MVGVARRAELSAVAAGCVIAAGAFIDPGLLPDPTSGVTSLTTPPSVHTTATGVCPVLQQGSPIDADEPRVLLHTPEFAADPHRAYRDARSQYGSLVPMELAPGVSATLVVGYQTALRILNDPEHFPAVTRSW